MVLALSKNALFQNAKIQDLNVIHNRLSKVFSCSTLFQNAKIQDLNVIHNFRSLYYQLYYVVSECKDTRFECNSQRNGGSCARSDRCFRMQRYKI